jgi:RNA polymerase sigma factor (sigma-70 family)
VNQTEPVVAGSPSVLAVAAEPSGDVAGGLVERLRAGSRAAMTEIFTAHGTVIYNYCYRRTGSWSAAEDLTSTVFLEVWRSRRRSVETGGSILPWLYGVATNVCRNHQRSQRRRTEALARLHLVDVDEQVVADEVVDQLEVGRRVERVLRQLAALPQTEQDVFLLVCWEELSYAETAVALGIPIGTVRSRLARVRRSLRILEQPEGDDD